MVSELSEDEKKIIMAYDFSIDDPPTASLPRKRDCADVSCGTGVTSDLSASPTKRQKTGVVGELAEQKQVEQDSSPSLCNATDASELCRIRAPASVIGRQRNDPELQKKIHAVETDYWQDLISRTVYNEERFKLYTAEEAVEACIVWPSIEDQSPAGYRECELECGVNRCFTGGPDYDDRLFEFRCPFDEVDDWKDDEEGEGRGAEKREAGAEKRWRDEIERKFNDPEEKKAEYERWEKIREVETEYYDGRIEREEYNDRRFALYSEEEKKERGIVWALAEHEAPRSPAGFRDFVFEQWYGNEPDWQTRMDFHWPYNSEHTDTTPEKNLCDLCISLIPELVLKEREAKRKLQIEQVIPLYDASRAKMKVAEEMHLQREQVIPLYDPSRAKMKAAEEMHVRKRMKRQGSAAETEKKSAEEEPIHCTQCDKEFVAGSALAQHIKAKHKN